jgi:hypothetical protein
MSRYPHHEKAEWAVDRARSELQRMGFVIGIPGHVCAKGADLLVHGVNGGNWRCEVKLAMLSKCGGGSTWRVNRVTRKKDDLIAIVFPSGAVVILDMKSHLKLCGPNGDRYIQGLGKVFG